jgi:hypothetical protein
MTLLIDTKPTLEWVGLQAETIFGIYEIESDANTLCMVLLYATQRDSDNMNYYWYSLKFHSLSTAKAAAQADYERRTAERFRVVEVPMDAPFDNNLHTDMVHGYDTAIDALLANIAKAKEQG